MKNIFILLPSPSPSGPIKGAFAMANRIKRTNNVHIVFLKKGVGVSSYLSKEVKVINLSNYKSWINKLVKFQNIIDKFEDTVILSMCFSADFFNLFLRTKSYKISSIRGNLFKNYLFEYGLIGVVPAFLQLYIQKFFNQTFSMNNSMSKMIKRISGQNSIVIPNFIDENITKKHFKLHKDLNSPLKFIFIGQLNRRKNPILLIKSFYKIMPINSSLDIIGDGPLYSNCINTIKKLNLENHIRMHSFLKNPLEILSQADVFVLPSYSEGTSRSMLEALFLGIICVTRDVDSNKEVINEDNGILFNRNEELPSAMLKAAYISKNNLKRKNLLPITNRQTYVESLFLNIFGE